MKKSEWFLFPVAVVLIWSLIGCDGVLGGGDDDDVSEAQPACSQINGNFKCGEADDDPGDFIDDTAAEDDTTDDNADDDTADIGSAPILTEGAW